MNADSFVQTTMTVLATVGLKILGAVVLWLVGRWLIAFAIRLLGRALDRQQFDTVTRSRIHSGRPLPIDDCSLTMEDTMVYGVVTGGLPPG